jgi:hypothetical protein
MIIYEKTSSKLNSFYFYSSSSSSIASASIEQPLVVKILTTGIVKKIIHPGCHNPKSTPKSKYINAQTIGYVTMIFSVPKNTGTIGIKRNTSHPGCHNPKQNPNNKNTIKQIIGVAAIILVFKFIK